MRCSTVELGRHLTDLEGAPFDVTHDRFRLSHYSIAPGAISISQADREGFEPPVDFSTLIFKTSALNHSATRPNKSLTNCEPQSSNQRIPDQTLLLDPARQQPMPIVRVCDPPEPPFVPRHTRSCLGVPPSVFQPEFRSHRRHCTNSGHGPTLLSIHACPDGISAGCLAFAILYRLLAPRQGQLSVKLPRWRP